MHHDPGWNVLDQVTVALLAGLQFSFCLFMRGDIAEATQAVTEMAVSGMQRNQVEFYPEGNNGLPQTAQFATEAGDSGQRRFDGATRGGRVQRTVEECAWLTANTLLIQAADP